MVSHQQTATTIAVMWPKAPSTPATTSKQHRRMLQLERFFRKNWMLLRQSQTLLRHCCQLQQCRSNVEIVFSLTPLTPLDGVRTRANAGDGLKNLALHDHTMSTAAARCWSRQWERYFSVRRCLRDPTFSRFGTVPACKRQTDGQTCYDS